MHRIRTATTTQSVIVSALLPLSLVSLTTVSHAQITVAPAFAPYYSFVNLGSAPGVVTSYGGLTVSSADANTLLIGANANTASATVDSIGVTRTLVNGESRISGFTGSASVVSTAAGITSGGIDGGLAYGPNNVLFYSSYSDNSIGEIKTGGTSPAKQISLTSLGVASSTGGLQFVPGNLPNAGKLWVTSYSGGGLYEASVTADGTGTYDIGSFTNLGNLGSGPEGIIFVPAGSPGFSSNAIIVSQYSTGQLEAYNLDASGDPIFSSAQPFMTGLSGAEGGTIDPSTGDLMFSTFGGTNQVISVRGFTPTASTAPEPGELALLSLGAPFVMGIAQWRRRKQK